jgi:AraC-like DNA-binding protein
VLVRYREIRPKDSLARFVECFWTLESEPGRAVTSAERILPDGCAEIVLNFGAAFCELRGKGRRITQPLRFLVGQMTRPMLIAPTGVVQLLGIRFQPGGTFPFFRIPMHELTDRVVELGAVSGDLERDLTSACERATTLPARVATIEEVLAKWLRRDSRNSFILRASANIVNTAGRVCIDTLANDAGISPRQLERRFLSEIGLGPKHLCRILRFQEVFRAVDRNDPEWAAVALECGYYDQSHLIRDFHQFAQQTPATLFANPSALTEAFTRKHRTSDFSNTLA